ncbi:hypothetical protein ABI953_22185, partial [Bacillus paralicheniformis]|uniref:hypothetical protein n=1 Tax=Bacillus paralicheniformis TaxID=1648923 RepID=UPI003D1AA5C7
IRQYDFLKKRKVNTQFRKIVVNNYLDELRKLVTLKAQHTSGELMKTEFFTSLFKKISIETGLPKGYLERNIYEFIRILEADDNSISKLENKLYEVLKNNEILYFPTFRRIEEDITKLKGFSDDDNDYDDDDFDDDFHNNIEILLPELNEDSFSNKGELI